MTYYVNNVNTQNTQVLMEYGKRNELKNVYTYGNERISAETIVDASGNPDDGAAGSASANRSAKALESASGMTSTDGFASASNGASGNPLEEGSATNASGNPIDNAPGSLGGGASGILPTPDDMIPSAGDDDYTTDYYLYDGRGSVSQVINGETIVESYNYDPFGNVTSGAPDFDSFYGYNAEETNPVTGLQYLRARYYDTEDGRFSVADTYLGDVSKPLTLNRYAYTANNPVMNIDPSGHIFGWVKNAVSKAVDVVKSVGSAIGNGIKAAYNHLVDAAQERAGTRGGKSITNRHNSSERSPGVGSNNHNNSSNTGTTPYNWKTAAADVKAYVQQKMAEIKERMTKPFCDGSMEKIDKQSEPLRDVRDLKDYNKHKLTEDAQNIQKEAIYDAMWGGYDILSGIKDLLFISNEEINDLYKETYPNDATNFQLRTVDSDTYEDNPLLKRFIKDLVNNEIAPNTVDSLNFLIPDDSIITIGGSATGANNRIAVTMAMGVAIDPEGNVYGTGTLGGGGGSTNGSAGIFVTETETKTIDDLSGLGFQTGGSVWRIGLDRSIAKNQDNVIISGKTLTFSAHSFVKSAGEVHGMITYTWVTEEDVNLFEETQNMYDNIMKW